MSLEKGSITFVAFSGDNANEGFTFAALAGIPAGTVLTFKVASSATATPTASFTWEAPSNIAAGTLVSFTQLQSPTPKVQIGAGPATTIPEV